MHMKSYLRSKPWCPWNSTSLSKIGGLYAESRHTAALVTANRDVVECFRERLGVDLVPFTVVKIH